MSAVSPGPEKACAGSVWAPLLCTLLQATHQVDRRSSDHPQPCDMQTPPHLNAYPLPGHASTHLVFLSLLASGGFFIALKINYITQTHPHMAGLKYWSQWITRMYPCWLNLKVFPFFRHFVQSHTLIADSLVCHYSCMNATSSHKIYTGLSSDV